MRKKTATLILTALLVGCTQPGTLMSYAKATNKANDGKRVALEGFLRYRKGVEAKDGVLALDLVGRPGGGEGEFAVNATTGTEANQVEAPAAGAGPDSVKLKTNDGKPANSMDKVRISGVLRYRNPDDKETFTLIPPILIERAGGK